MNQETTLLRAGRAKDAGELTADKTRLAQDYVGFARSVQRQAARLRTEAPDAGRRLRGGHERLATQMAENLRVLATARTVTEDLLTDVAKAMSAKARPKTYGANGEVAGQPPQIASGDVDQSGPLISTVFGKLLRSAKAGRKPEPALFPAN